MQRSRSPAVGYTIVEILVALSLSLVLMVMVVHIIGTVGTSIARGRAGLEMADRLRAAQARLSEDLGGVTVSMAPPRDPAANEGYFEYTEGPAGFGTVVTNYPYTDPRNLDDGGSVPDTTVGDLDDMLLFTTHSKTQPFVGKLSHVSGGVLVEETIQSPDAEVAWLVRGRTLYRRVLLVAPQCLNVFNPGGNGRIYPATWTLGAESFFKKNDISVRRTLDASNVTCLAPNTLGDLTKPEDRFAHQTAAFPYHPHAVTGWSRLGLPTLSETASDAWQSSTWFTNGVLPTASLGTISEFDAWTKPYPFTGVDPTSGTLTALSATDRIGEDVILTNVIGFDVKAWDPNAPVLQYSGGPALLPGDPGYRAAVVAYLAGGGSAPAIIGRGAYVDLGYGQRAAAGAAAWSDFSGLGNAKSGLDTLANSTECVYDTWSTHYEEGGTGTNGFDDDGNGVVDDAGELVRQPPYPVPLRAIQVKIRIFDPDSRQIREVTVVQKF